MSLMSFLVKGVYRVTFPAFFDYIYPGLTAKNGSESVFRVRCRLYLEC